MKRLIVICSALLLSTVLSGCSNLDNKWNVDNSWCIKTEQPTETINLSADILFKYNGGKFDDILIDGQKNLKTLADSLKEKYVTIDKIVVTGHTDKIGSYQFNDQLGLTRADTIRDYLRYLGIDTQYVTNSKGKREPVVTSCVGEKVSEELKSCLQPNRRVVIEIYGTKK